MYRQIIIPTEKDHTIDLPVNLYGKKVEVIAFEIPADKNVVNGKKAFLADIEPIPDFPSIDEIRREAWPAKW